MNIAFLSAFNYVIVVNFVPNNQYKYEILTNQNATL